MSRSRILVLFADPAFERSRGNRFQVGAVPQVDDHTFRDLYEEYPDFIDVSTEQQLLVEHEVIVLQRPLYRYSCPALLKEWLVRCHDALWRRGRISTRRRLNWGEGVRLSPHPWRR